MKISHLPRIYVDTLLAEGEAVNLGQNYAFYLKTVLRIKVGSVIRIFNSTYGEFLAEVINIFCDSILLKTRENLRKPEQSNNVPKLTLALSIIKQNKMLDAIDMSVQLGVDEIYPIIATRSQINNINKQKFIQRIIEATEQSGRISVPTIYDATKLSSYKSYNGLIIYANEKEHPSNTIMKAYLNNSSLFLLPTIIIIGPEGGFTNDELDLLSSLTNSYSVSLSQNILRTETAVAAALAQVHLAQNKLN